MMDDQLSLKTEKLLKKKLKKKQDEQLQRSAEI